ncbi:MAG: recombinase family protein, partial [Clostridiales bacterium]|nr:recombinase family protein [Clostridiales bacterium]
MFVKSVSRLSRNTADLIATINKLHALGIAILFDKENIMSTDTKMRFLLEINGVFAQSESQAISENIKLGLKHLKKDGRSGLYRRKCLGYKHNEYGELVINEEEAAIVRNIFSWYLEGYSVNKIIKELSSTGVKSPKGSDKWPKRTIQNMLVNEKYIGNVLLGK